MKNSKQIVLIFLSIIFCANFAFSQEEKSPHPDSTIEADVQPRVLNLHEVKVKIGYPMEAAKAGIEGLIVARVLISEEGEYVKHIVTTEAHSILQNSVEQYLPELRFTPAIQNGKAIKFWVNIPFRFKIDSGKTRSGGGERSFSRRSSCMNLLEVRQRVGYPQEAKDAKIAGKLVYRVLVDREGNYVRHKVKKKGPSILQKAVEAHLSELEFRPRLYKGKPISVWVNIPFYFEL